MRLVTLLAVLSVGCTSCDSRTPSTKFAGREGVFELAPGDAGVTLYEGLPHPFHEASYQTELESKPTVEMRSYHFYRDPVPVREGAAERLYTLLGAAKSFRQWGGTKTCGGFHPDWCVEVQAKDGTTKFLLCFGCSEAKVYSPSGDLYCDINKDAEEELKAILDQHRTNRPPRQPK